MRLFVAVWPPPDVVARLAALPRPGVAGLRWTTADQWHVTLRFLGDADEEQAISALWGLRVDESPEAVLGPRVGRFGGTVLHVPVAGLDRLAAAAVAATAGVGEPPGGRPFRGHITLGRVNRGRADLRPLVGASVAARWTVAEVTLVASALRPRGARYEVLGRVPLPAPARDA